MSSCYCHIKKLVVAWILVSVILFLAWRLCLPRDLVDFLGNVTQGISIEKVRSYVSNKFFVGEEQCIDPEYLVDRVFNKSGCVCEMLVYAQIAGDRFADARVYFDCDQKVVGISYSADGFSQLKQTIIDGVGPGGARCFLPSCQYEETNRGNQ